MPDGDRFMRKLKGTGKGWGVAYKLACSDSPHLSAQILKACADNLRNYSKDALAETVDVLVSAFERENWARNENLMSSADVFLTLEKEFKSLKIKGDFDLVGVLEKTVKSVFIENGKNSAAMSKELVVEKLGESLVLNIMDSRWLSRIRDGLMKERNWDIAHQIIWEQNLRGQVISGARKMMKNSFKGDEMKHFRAPVSRGAKKSTADILNQRLTVLPPVG